MSSACSENILVLWLILFKNLQVPIFSVIRSVWTWLVITVCCISSFHVCGVKAIYNQVKLSPDAAMAVTYSSKTCITPTTSTVALWNIMEGENTVARLHLKLSHLNSSCCYVEKIILVVDCYKQYSLQTNISRKKKVQVTYKVGNKFTACSTFVQVFETK